MTMCKVMKFVGTDMPLPPPPPGHPPNTNVQAGKARLCGVEVGQDRRPLQHPRPPMSVYQNPNVHTPRSLGRQKGVREPGFEPGYLPRPRSDGKEGV